MPSTDDLTKKIISAKIAHVGSSFMEVDDPSKFSWDYQTEFVNRIRILLELIKKYLGNHYSFNDRDFNYEDYFYIVDSLHEDENMNFENPVVNFFSEYLIKKHPNLFDPINELFSRITLIDLCSKAKDLISDIVTFSLDNAPKTLNHLNFLIDLFKEESLDHKYIFTLNHDIVIERFFAANQIKYSDGFNQFDDTIRIWDNGSIDGNIILLKLHGSVNWYSDRGLDWYDDRVCIYRDVPRGADRPLIQIGSFNKIHQYNRGIFFQLQCLFAKYLEAVDTVIISGYSFGDQGINNRLIDWFYRARNKKIIVIHPNPESLKFNSRPAIAGKWNGWLNSESLKIIPKYIENVSWSEIMNVL